MLQLSLAILTILALSLLAGDAAYVSSSSLLLLLLQLITMPLCEHPSYGVAHCRQELHTTISSVVVYTP